MSPRGKHSRPSHSESRSAYESRQSQVPKRQTTAPHLAARRNAEAMKPVRPVDTSAYSAQAARSARKKSSKRRFWNVVFVISLVVFIGSLIGLGAIAYQYWAQDNAYASLEDKVNVSDAQSVPLSDLQVNWDELRAINPDVVAWIYVPDTKINYPIVQTDNNETYLHTSFAGETGWLGSAGSIFLDYRNNPELLDRNSAIYGHYMNDGSMFGAFSNMTNDESFNEHRDVFLLTPQGNYRLKTFSCILTTGDDTLVRTTFGSEEEYRVYVQELFDRSAVNQVGEQLSVDDVQQTFMFSTCEYSQTNGRAVICTAVVETTIPDNPYVSAQDLQGSGLSEEEAASVGN